MYITFSISGQDSIFACIDQCLLYFLRKLIVIQSIKKMIGLKSTRAISNQFIYQSKSSSRQCHIRRLGFFLSVLKQKFSKFYLLFTIHLLSETCCQIWQPSRLWSSEVSRNATSISSMAKIVPIITWIWPLKGKCFGNFTLVQNVYILQHLKPIALNQHSIQTICEHRCHIMHYLE